MPLKQPPSHDRPAAGLQRLRIGLKLLLPVGFAGLILVALSSAFLLALAAVGVLAIAVGVAELIRRHVGRPARPVLTAFARRPTGY